MKLRHYFLKPKNKKLNFVFFFLFILLGSFLFFGVGKANAAVTDNFNRSPAPVTDNFNRADGGLGSDWTTITLPSGFSNANVPPLISGNKVVFGEYWETSSNYSAAYRNGTFSDNQYAQVKIGNIGAGNWDGPGGPLVRYSGGWKYYLANVYANGVLDLVKMDDSDSWTQLGGDSPTNVQEGDTVAIRAIGSQIEVLLNGVIVISVEDNTYTGGQPGIYTYYSYLDDFEAGSIEGLGSDWTTLPSGDGWGTVYDPVISGNKVINTSRFYTVAYRNGTFFNDQYAQVKIQLGSYGAGGPFVRYSGNWGYYLAYIATDGSITLYKMDSDDNWTPLGDVSPINAQTGDTVAVRAVGSTIQVLLNGVVVISAEDSTYTGGQPGIYVDDGPLDDFEAGSIDTTGPVRSDGSPSGELSSNTTSATLSLKTDENATCKYDTSSKAYADMGNTFSTTGGQIHSQEINNLSSGQTYTYYIRCQDESKNTNDTDYLISFSIASQNNSSNDSTHDNAKITSWKASPFTDKSSCPQKIKLTVKGHHFQNNTEVRIGNTQASSTDKKSSQEITANFCLSKLLNIQTDHQRSVSVKNPDTSLDKDNKKINLDSFLPKKVISNPNSNNSSSVSQRTAKVTSHAASNVSQDTGNSNNSNPDNSLPTGQAGGQQTQPQVQSQPQATNPSQPAKVFIWWNPFTWFQ